MKGVDAPIVPVNLDGVWGSIFSFERGRFLWKMPRSIPYPVTVSFGKPHAPDRHAFRGARGRAAIANGGLCPPQDPHAHAAPQPDPHRAPFALPLRHGRQAPPAHEMGRRAAQRDLSRAPPAASVERPGNGRHPAAAVGARRPGEFRGNARGQNPGKSELHRLERIARLLRRAVQAGNGHHHQGAARPYSAARSRARPSCSKKPPPRRGSARKSSRCCCGFCPAAWIEKAHRRRHDPNPSTIWPP